MHVHIVWSVYLLFVILVCPSFRAMGEHVLIGSPNGDTQIESQEDENSPDTPVRDFVDECVLADIVFVMDGSGSIGPENWLTQLQFLKDVVNEFKVGPSDVQIGVVTFANFATVQFHLNTYPNKEEIMDAIDGIEYKNQNTNTSGGIRVMREEMFVAAHGDRPLVSNIGIIITDGESTRDSHLTVPEANIAKQAGILLFALGVGAEVNHDELVGIANSPADSFVFHVDNFDMLSMIRLMLVEQACMEILGCREFNDIVFVLDTSGSVGSSNFNLVKNFVAALCRDSIDIGGNMTHVGLVTFSASTQIHFHLNGMLNSEQAAQAVESIQYSPGGSTNTAEAIRVARGMFTVERGERPTRRNVLVLFTDGGSNDYRETVTEATICHVTGIEILVVAVTGWVNTHEIKAVASDPDKENVFKIDNFSDLAQIKESLQVAMCAEPNRCSLQPCVNGGTCVNEINNYHCLCPPHFAGKRCEYSCSQLSDVVVALDTSSSIGVSNWDKAIQFTKTIAENLNGGISQTRFGFQTFSTSAEVIFHLDSYPSRIQYKKGVEAPYLWGTTNTAEALRQMRNEMFMADNGDRMQAPNLGIIITDGRSNHMFDTFREAAWTRSNGTRLMVIGINIKDKYGNRELSSIVSSPSEQMLIQMNSFDDLLLKSYEVIPTVIEAVCNNVDNCDGVDCGRGKCVDKLFSYECICPRGFTGIHCERQCDGAADIVFAVDVSGSILTHRFEWVKQFLHGMLEQLEISNNRTRVALIAFSDDASIEVDLGQHSHKETMLQTIENLEHYGGRTNIASALRMTRDVFGNSINDRFDVPNFGILITDGEATIDKENTIPEAIRARVDGIHLMVVTTRSEFTSHEIRMIASEPKDANIFTFDRFEELPALSEILVQGMCNDVNECVENPCLNGNPCVDGLSQRLCLCMNEYTGVDCERRCTRRLDVLFVIDASEENKDKLLTAIELSKRVISGLNFDVSRTRTAMLAFGEEPQVVFHLNHHSDKQEIINAVSFTTVSGRTNAADAIRFAREEMFTVVNGDRTGDQDVLILLYDGFSRMNGDRTLSEAEEASNRGIRVITVGVGERLNSRELDAVASTPSSENVFTVANSAEIESTANLILDNLCM